MSLGNLLGVSFLVCTMTGYARPNPELTAEQTRVLDAVRIFALQYTEDLPDFICTQITRRDATNLANFGTSFNGTGSSRTGTGLAGMPLSTGVVADVIEEQLTFYDQAEHYEVIAVDGRRSKGQEHMEFAGAISAGEFGSALHNLFEPRTRAKFIWDRTAHLAGRRVYVFKFYVPSENGNIVMDRDTNQKILSAYSGRLFVDCTTLQVLRITSEVELPVAFPIKMATTTVDYKPVEIAGKTYILPSHSEVRLKDSSRLYVNQIEFRNYHRFAVESTIHYEGDGQPQKH